MQALLYADLGKKSFSERPGGGSFAWPKLVQGDDVRIGLRFTGRANDQAVEVNRTVQSLRATLGRDDARPERGGFKLKIGGGAPVAGENVTTALAFDATPEQWAAAINALTGLTADEKDVTVVLVDGSYRVTLKDGSGKEFSVAENALFPVSFMRFRTHVVDGNTVHECRLTQSPVAFTDAFAAVVPLPPTITPLRDGGESGGSTWNEVQKLTVPPAFRGTYQIGRGFRKTPLLSADDGVEEITEALKSLADEDGEFLVSNPVGNAAHIEFSGSMAGTDQELLTISVFDAPPGDPTFTLSLDTSELAVFLNRRPSTPEKLVLEIELLLENEHDDEVTELVSFRSEVEAVRELTWAGLAAAQNINWIRPPLPKDYTPFTEDQVAVGVLHFGPVLIGNGVDTEFVIDHDLASELILPLVRENHSDGKLLRMGADFTCVINDGNSVTITLLGDYADPVPALNALAVGIVAFGQASLFNAHTHTIPQVLDLEDILNDLGGRVEVLENAAGISGISSPAEPGATGIIAQWTLPQFLEVLAMREQLSLADKPEETTTTQTTTKNASGTSVATQVVSKNTPDSGSLLTLAAIPRAQLSPKRSGLLPAVHDAVTDPLTVPLPASGFAPLEGRAFENQTGNEVLLPGGLGRRGARLKPGEFAAVLHENGRTSWYRVKKYAAGEISFYPEDFERELFMIAVNEQQLRIGKRLEVKLGLEVGVIGTNTKAVWHFVMEHGVFTKKTTAPLPTGANLKEIVWNATPILEQRIIVTPVASTHRLGCRITRTGAETITSKKLFYGDVQAGDSAPASPNFALRARLIRFDTEDSQPDPRGFVAFAGLNRGFTEETDDSLGFAIVKSA